ncbi:MAG: PAS domain S-box protein [Vulcanimicrobiota bacterium]
MSDRIRKKLLIVDDEAIIAYQKADTLKKNGFDVISVISGEKAINAVKSDPEISLVLMDISLGSGMAGNEAAKAILEIRSLPIVFLTSYSDETIVEKVYDIPRFGFVTKDSGDAVLMSSIDMALRLFEYQTKLKESEERWSLAIEGVGEGIWDWNRQTDEVYYSPQWKAILGFEINEIGNTIDEWDKRIHPDDKERVYQELHQCFNRDTPAYKSEHRLQCRNGTYKWILDRGKVINWTADGKPLRVVGTHTDITERKNIENALRESEERYHSLFSTMLEGFAFHRIICDDDGRPVDYRFLEVNPAFEALTGLKAQDLIGRTVLEALPGTEPEWIERYGQIALTGRSERFTSYASAIGKWFEVSAYRTESGYFATLFVDITDRKLAEASLRESEEKFRTAFETSPDLICIIRMPDEVFVDVNGKFTEITGYTRDEILGKSVNEIGLWNDPKDIERLRAELAKHKYVDTIEMRFRLKDNRFIDCLLSASVTTINGIPHVLSITKNIDDLKRAEQERVRLVTAIEQSAETIVITDNCGTIVYANPAFEKITGYSREEAIGANPRILKSGFQENNFYRNMWNTIARGDVWSGRIINRKKDGSFFEEEATVSPVKDESGEVVNYVAVKRDITREVTLQKQLLQAQKMEAIGTLAGGIAHDFNNILQIIIGFSEILLHGENEGTSKAGDLQRIMDAANNGAELVKGLLTFSRKVEPKFVPLNINKKVLHTIKLMEHTFPKMIQIQTGLSEDLWDISADPTQIEQIMMNLALNACDAMPYGGRLTFSTDNITLDAEKCRFFLGCSPGDYVHLTISDTGLGIEREMSEHIFEPFFTTKEPGSGTGLGLAIVYGIVQQHGGFISYDTTQGQGTSFDIYFKALRADIWPETAEREPASAISGIETLLFVDDEDSVRKMGERILREAGYTVLIAENGQQALESAIREKERISLVILDLSMPEMGGMDCLKKLVEAIPEIRILIMSGYAADANPEECLKMGARGFISKPFRMNDLLQKVRTVLKDS